MKQHWKKVALFLLLALAAGILAYFMNRTLTLETVKTNSDTLAKFIEQNYLLSVAVFGIAFLTTAFIVPGALVLTVTGGYFFGPVPGGLYAAVFSTAGSVLAFLLSRHILGEWIQQRYERRLRLFNAEVSQHGSNYLFVIRVIPVMPAFLVNYLSGLTRISVLKFSIVSFLGTCPGAFVYALAGRQLRSIESIKDVTSVNVLAGFGLLALFALLPVFRDIVRRARSVKKHERRP